MSKAPKHKPPKTTGRKGHKTLVADCSGSECFSDLRYSNGQIFATFRRDGYEEILDADKSIASEWFNSGSLGGWYNDN